jgi:dCTP deaminase
MILNDKQINHLAKTTEMIIPFEEQLVSILNNRKVVSYGLSSYGYDIRLSEKDFRIFTARKTKTAGSFFLKDKINDPKYFGNDSVEPLTSLVDKNGEFFVIPAHGYALGVSVEAFNMPEDVTGVCVGKSTYARAGIIANITPLEAGWRGYLTLEFANTSNTPCRLYVNEGIAQVLFFKGESCQTSYSDRKGKYQNQPQTVIFSKV